MEPHDPFVGTTFDGRFFVERALAEGGMGAVYVAVQQPAGRRVALKVIKDDGTHEPELLARFERETAALCSLSHPNVVTMLDCGNDHGNLFLVMELLSGRSLRSELQALRAAGHVMTARRALRIANDVARALVAVHGSGIVHRDLKPENIFLTSSAGHSDFAKLLDFGVVNRDASGRGPRLTETGAFIGTAGYGSPEQLLGDEATPASDLYALGVILYEMLTGVSPFDAPTLQAMFVRQLVEPVPPPSAIAPALAIAPAVDDIVASLLAREPLDRPPSAAALVAVLEELLEGLPHERTRSTPLARARRATAITPLRSTAVTEASPRRPPSTTLAATSPAGLPALTGGIGAPPRALQALRAGGLAGLAICAAALSHWALAPNTPEASPPAARVLASAPAAPAAPGAPRAPAYAIELWTPEGTSSPTRAKPPLAAPVPRATRYRRALDAEMRARAAMVDACLAANPARIGEASPLRFVLALQVGVDGKVEGVYPRSLSAGPVAQCISEELQGATLPRPPGGAALDVEHLFVLDRDPPALEPERGDASEAPRGLASTR